MRKLRSEAGLAGILSYWDLSWQLLLPSRRGRIEMVGIDQIYLVSGAIGFVYIVGTAIVGQLGDNDGDGAESDDGIEGAEGGDDGGPDDDGGADDDGHDGAITKIGHSAMHTAAGPFRRSYGVLYFLLKIFSPMRIALWLFIFGAGGIMLLRAFPMLGGLSTILAAVIAFDLSNRVLRLIGRLIRKMQRGEAHRKEDAIGASGTLTVPITDGGVGEVTFVQGGMRVSGPARAVSSVPSASLSKSSRVVISDFRDGVFFVELVEEELL